MSNPVWEKNLKVFRKMSENERDEYISKLNDSLAGLDPSAKDIVIEYIEFLVVNEYDDEEEIV